MPPPKVFLAISDLGFKRVKMDTRLFIRPWWLLFCISEILSLAACLIMNISDQFLDISHKYFYFFQIWIGYLLFLCCIVFTLFARGNAGHPFVIFQLFSHKSGGRLYNRAGYGSIGQRGALFFFSLKCMFNWLLLCLGSGKLFNKRFVVFYSLVWFLSSNKIKFVICFLNTNIYNSLQTTDSRYKSRWINCKNTTLTQLNWAQGN